MVPVSGTHLVTHLLYWVGRDKFSLLMNSELDPGSELKLFNCGNEMFGNLFLAATTGSWPKDKFCMAYDDRLNTDSNTSYTISADLLNYQSSSDPGFGHLGLAYNFFDTDNYEGLFQRYSADNKTSPLSNMKDLNI